MLFNSFAFIFLFLPVTFAGFFFLGKYAPKSYAVFWLVLASFFFYGYWDYHYVPLLFASISFNYFIGKKIEAAQSKKWLIFGIAIDVILLGYFKYTDFFLNTINDIAGADSFDLPHIILPLGISFFTFTQIAYLVDVFRGNAKNYSFVAYCEFVTIFPHLIAGPIIDYKEMIPQFIAEKTFKINYQNIAAGLTLFTLGLFKKVAVADKLAPWVNDIYSHIDSLTFVEAWLGALGYTLQLYFDFSGYSEMAIGLGLIFNLKLPVNFNSPYQSLSIIDFWRRWHMTLGRWVKYYLYIPLGGNRQGEGKKMRNLFSSMLIIGLWHGAGWTFIFWGGLHGLFLMINHQWRRLNITLPNGLCWCLTFLCVVICWVFFRAENFHDAFTMLSKMADITNIAIPYSMSVLQHMPWITATGIPLQATQMPIKELAAAAGEVAVLLPVVVFCPNPVKWMDDFQANYKWLAVIIVLMLFSLFQFSQVSDFLYFQF